MHLRKENLSDEGLRRAGTIAPPPDSGLDSGPIAFALEARMDGDDLRVTGWMHATVNCECSRCLGSARVAVERDIDLSFVPHGQAPVEEEMELDDDDLDTDYYPEDGLDLRAVLAEQLLLGVPMKVLCAEECQGLCPQCGANRNQQPCECEPPGDPRLADLADLRDQL